MIRQRCTEITHITVHEVLDRSGYPQLGRIMFSGVALGAFIEPEVDDGDDNDEEDGDRDGDDDEESETLGDLARMDNGVTYAVLADAGAAGSGPRGREPGGMRLGIRGWFYAYALAAVPRAAVRWRGVPSRLAVHAACPRAAPGLS